MSELDCVTFYGKLTTTELPQLFAHVKPSFTVLELGIHIDGQLTMADYIAVHEVGHASYEQLGRH